MARTPRDPVFAEERRQRIADTVAAQGRVRLADLVAAFGVTEPTIRKDLEDLQRRRLVRRTHGGAIAVQSHLEVPIHDRTEQHREAKQRIARACRAEIRRGESLFLDSGTTVEQIADQLDGLDGLDGLDVNLLTNALGVAGRVADRPGIRHTLIGGQVRAAGGSLVGPVALDNLARFSVDTAFIGASGLTADGISVADVAEAQIKQAVIARARRVIVPLDSSKLGVSDFVRVCGLEQIDMIITEQASDEVTQWCAENDVTVRVADAVA